MATIPLTRGMVALVDESDHAALAAHKWCATNNGLGRFYALRHVRRADGSWRTLYMHNAIMGEPPQPGLTADHRDTTASLDNRRENLRWATRQQQTWNRRRSSSNTSGYKGVTWSSRCKKWQARIRHGGKDIFLGYYGTAEAAGKAYDIAASRLCGEFACVNLRAAI